MSNQEKPPFMDLWDIAGSFAWLIPFLIIIGFAKPEFFLYAGIVLAVLFITCGLAKNDEN